MKSVVGIMSVICPGAALQSGLQSRLQSAQPEEPFRDYFGNQFEADTLGTRIKQVTGGVFVPEKMAKLRRVEHSNESSQEEETDANTYVKGRVSIVTLTMPSREAFHPSLWRSFRAQTYKDKELVVVETHAPKETPSTFFTQKTDAEHEHDLVYAPMEWKKKEELHVGVKRDITLFLASGEFLVQFDDGDAYAPTYVSKVLSMFQQKTVAVTTTGWYSDVRDNGTEPYGCYTDSTKCPLAVHGTDFASAYKREPAIAHPFLDVQAAESIAFMMRMKYAGEVKAWNDTTGLRLHVLNTSASESLCCSYNYSSKDLKSLEAMKGAE